MSETAKQFVARLRLAWTGQITLDDYRRVTDLALRGAETAMVPIEEWDKAQVYIDAAGARWKWDEQPNHHSAKRRPFWNADTMGDTWNRTHQPTHGVPLTALGEPKP